MINSICKKTLCVSIALCFTGCATAPGQTNGANSFITQMHDTFASDDPCSNNARNIGIGVGALAGGLIGSQLGNNKNAGIALGLLAGATLGGFIGADMDRKRCELSKIAKQYDLDMAIATVSSDGVVIDDAMMKLASDSSSIKEKAIGSVVSVTDQNAKGSHFESNSDQLTPKAKLYFSAIADTYNAKKVIEGISDQKEKDAYLQKDKARKLLLVGHTDDTGSSKLNADLSERRAKTVSKFMEEKGIAKSSLYFQGAGEFYPVADNNSENGRAKNRRVEIVELANAANFDKYLTARTPRYEFYRSSGPSTSGAAALDMPKANNQKITSAKQSASQSQNAKSVAKPSAVATVEPAASKQVSASTSEGKTRELPIVAASNSKQENYIDFAGTPLLGQIAATDVGSVEVKKPFFSLISSAYADEPKIISDCTLDRPRSANGVKSLTDGKVYKTSEHIPGLYGKTWTDRVNGHQIVINKVSVLASDGSLANPPEFKVYKNYKPEMSRNVVPDVMLRPEVNTYLGSKGVLYRMFISGQAGMQCVDILFKNDGGTLAKAGKLVYIHASKPYVAEFKPMMYQ